jgi:anhydro-N-acetylmuramic acid kinase
MKTYKVIGMMSGTSMDGIDLAYCELTPEEDGKWKYSIGTSTTVAYDEVWRLRLSKLRNQNALVFHKTDRYYGEYIGRLINSFIDENKLEVDLVAAHGHTVFHQPENNITVQVGNSNAIAGVTGLPVVANFRALDVVKGGEGAPLAAIGDDLLFSEYDMCLNIGGFSNISAIVDGGRIAYDISPANIALNRIAREFGQEYDDGGKIAESGSIDYDLLGLLNNIPYYEKSYPKSLGREWIMKNFWYIVRESKASKEDKMKTLCDHIGDQIGSNIENLNSNSSQTIRVLATGGGVFNNILVDHIRTHTDAEIVIPDSSLINYKEALIFALLGILRVRNEFNILKQYTGADTDSVAGELCGDFSAIP